MGYNLRREHVRQGEATLAEIKQAIEHGRPAVFPSEPNELTTLQYRLFKLLKAAELFRDELNGEYAGLRAATRIKLDTANCCIRVEPIAGAPLTIRALQPTEHEAVNKLDSYPGSMTDIEFVPSSSFSEDSLAELVAAKGWSLYRESRFDVPDSDRIAYFCERVDQSELSSFDIIST